MCKGKPILCFCLLFLLGTVRIYSQSVENIFEQATQLFDQNNYSSAQEYYFKALRQAEVEHKPDISALASISLARNYYYLYDHKAAFKWSYNALRIIQQYRLDSLLSKAHYFLGVLYIEARKVDSAEKYANKAIGQMKLTKDYTHLSQTYSTLAQLYILTSKNTSQIEKMIDNAEKYASLAHNNSMMAFALSKRYNYYFYLKKDYKEALKYLDKEEKLYLESGDREAILNAFRAKAECLIMLRDTAARQYMLQWFAFKDSILQKEKSANVAKYETLYETQKKEEQNKLLKQQNEFKQLILVVTIAIFLLILVIILWLFNRNNFRKKQKELLLLQNQQYEKERIARDLHDNVGGQLSYIVYSLDGIHEEDKKKRMEVTDSINLSVRNVIGSLRETIWAISDKSITAQDFSDKLKVFARTIFKHSETQLHFIENIQNNKELNALAGLNLYRICQEILNNAFKHAQATEIAIEVNEKNEKLLIIVKDNGIGFDATQPLNERYGLQNIKKRSSEFGITLNLETGVNQGTTYYLKV